MSRPLRCRALRLLAVPVLAVVLTGCGPAQAPKPVEARPTPIARLNAAALDIPRVKYCDLITQSAVKDALGAKAGTKDNWANGEVAPVDGARSDVTHEFGCRFATGTAAAETWVFARPVDAGFARSVIAKTARRPGCTSAPGPRFGTPSQRQTCTLAGGVTRVRFAGLFGQTWLTCQVAAPLPAAEVTRRAGAWCVEGANATTTSR